eukprot:CAMPEP_0182512520 /NCGR_PEP_ID=MMETSP1321-20130603/32273_1 /TAXON_ID=91990 /ORGANISM="Bolidomonas sp., Strain RCC1657" /LENGTH=49 /DNA_ID=CAMNT_0024719359 /DNA_START=325 /DNA_END=474 /DNA_ORIENTATION=+
MKSSTDAEGPTSMENPGYIAPTSTPKASSRPFAGSSSVVLDLLQITMCL